MAIVGIRHARRCHSVVLLVVVLILCLILHQSESVRDQFSEFCPSATATRVFVYCERVSILATPPVY